jgi:hypothetical protein
MVVYSFVTWILVAFLVETTDGFVPVSSKGPKLVYPSDRRRVAPPLLYTVGSLPPARLTRQATSLGFTAKINVADLPLYPTSAFTVGYWTLFAALTPYLLGLLFPNFFNKNFFLPVYTDDKVGRQAEIYWKLMYAVLGLALTTLSYVEITTLEINDAIRILRDSYCLWAVFYTAAAIKIRIEATRMHIVRENRLFIQLWHSLLMIVMWAAASESMLLVIIWNAIVP